MEKQVELLKSPLKLSQDKGSRLKSILLDPLVPGGTALFSRQREIAKIISGDPDSSYYGKERSLVSMLNQVLRNRRPCPKKLIREIVILSFARLKELNASREKGVLIMSTELETRFSSIFFSDINSKPGNSLDLILSWQSNSEEIVFSAIDPEIFYPSKPGSVFFRELTLFQDQMLRGLLRGTTRYVFVFSREDHLDIQNFWSAIKILFQKRIEKKLGSKSVKRSRVNVDRLLNELGRRKRLLVYEGESHSVIVPLVAFNPHYSLKSALFYWDYSEVESSDKNTDIVRLSRTILGNWQRCFYSALREGKDFRRYYFRDFKIGWNSFDLDCSILDDKQYSKKRTFMLLESPFLKYRKERRNKCVKKCVRFFGQKTK